jgi:hypothetical protein
MTSEIGAPSFDVVVGGSQAVLPLAITWRCAACGS